MNEIITHSLNQQIEMIYLATDNKISQRTIRVVAVTDKYIKAYCYNKKQLRTFKIDNILSVGPANRKVGA